MRRAEEVRSVNGRVGIVVATTLIWLVALPLFAVVLAVRSAWDGLVAAWQNWSCEMRAGVRGEMRKGRIERACWPHLHWFRSTRIRFRDIDPPFGRFDEVRGIEGAVEGESDA